MSVWQAVGWALVHFVWQGAAVALVLALALAVTRRAPAPLRYALAVGALLGMVALPVGTAIRFHGTPPGGALAYDAADVLEVSPVGVPTVKDVTPSVSRTAAKGREPTPVGARAWSLERARAWLEPALPWLVAGWSLGVVLLSLRLLGGWLRARRLRTTAVRDVPAACRRALERIARRLGIAEPVAVLESALVAVPVVIGWLRPVVLLPASVFTGLTPAQLDAILAHELAHIRRHDYVVNLVQSAIETVLFYHPAVWWVSRRVRAEREHCCDDVAVALGGDARGYAGALVDMERLRGEAAAFALSAAGGSLVTRVQRLLQPDVSHRDTAPRWAAGAIAVVAALAVGGASGVPAAVAQRARGDEPHASKPDAAQARQGQGPDTVLRHPDPGAPLADRWTWALRTAQSRGAGTYWVGYTVQPPPSVRKLVHIDRDAIVVGENITLRGRLFGDFEGLHFPGVPLASLVGDAPGRVALLVQLRRDGSVAHPTRVHISSFPLPVDLRGLTLFWLGAGDDAASVTLLGRLYQPGLSTAIREELVSAVGIHGASDVVVPVLRGWLQSDEPTVVRAQAAEWLGWHAVPAALTALAAAARSDRAADVRREAAEAVGDLDLPDATDTLVVLARTLADGDARAEAVEALGQRPEARAREALAAIAREDRNVDVQREAVETLGDLAEREGGGAAKLIELARSHPHPDVRREAVETIGERLPAAEAVPILVDIARRDPNPDVQREAVESLGHVDGRAAFAAVRAIAADHPRSDVRREAVETMGEASPTDETVAELARIARADPHPDVQREAVETLGQLEGGIGLGAVIEIAMTHPHPDVRREAIETVTESADATEALRVLDDVIRNDASDDVRREAVEALGQLHDARALERLARIARTHPSVAVRREAVETLGEAGEPAAAVRVLREILTEDASLDVQLEAVETLAELHDATAVDVLLATARSHPRREVRAEALKCLAESDDPAAQAALRRALGGGTP
jgi:HEAT repeat protein/beta-lactamase regulating signal transducer with metallopeptidase domain